jgi:hypothetical protein
MENIEKILPGNPVFQIWIEQLSNPPALMNLQLSLDGRIKSRATSTSEGEDETMPLRVFSVADVDDPSTQPALAANAMFGAEQGGKRGVF